MAHGVMEEWTDRDSCGSEKSPGPAQGGGSGRVMGSRRIFAPQFKLQVLDSYRQDPDCKGNQRATARKYGIHRRQIQKWLQMESNLRSIASGGGSGSASSGGGSVMGSPAPSPRPSPSPTASLGLESHLALNLSSEARLLGVRGAPSPVTGNGSPIPSPPPTHHQVVAVPRLSVSPTLPIKKRWCHSPEQTTTPPPLASDEDDEDDEDIDVDGTESEASSALDYTTTEASRALDYTTATLSKRRSFSLQFKLEVLDAFKELPLCQGNQRATARKFGINRRQVQKWLGQETELREEAVSRGGLNRQRLGRWMEEECLLDLSRKRKHDSNSDLDDAETEAKKVRPASPSNSALAALSPNLAAVPTALGDLSHAHHPMLFRPQPLPMMPLPLSLSHLPFPICAKQYSVDLKLNMYQQSLLKWCKPGDFLKPTSQAPFLLNSFR